MLTKQMNIILSKQTALLTEMYKDLPATINFEDKVQWMKEEIDNAQGKGDWLGIAAAAVNLDTLYRVSNKLGEV